MKRMAPFALVAGSVAVLAGSVSAAAASPTRSAGGTAEAIQLEEVVVTAQKRQERLQDVPISMTVLGGDELDKTSVTSLMDAIGNVPGVSITGGQNAGLQGGGAQIAIRGVTAGGPQLSGTSPIAYYLDGVPFGLVKSAVVPDTGAYDLDRVEVLRGPQGTLYGASAQNGVVRVLTKDADLNDFDFKVRGAAGSTEHGAGNFRGDFAVNVPIIEGKLGARVVAGEEYLSGWINSPARNHVNDSRSTTLRLKINAQPADDLSIGLSAWHSGSRYGAPSIALPDNTITATEPEPTDIRYDTYGLKIGYEFSAFSLNSMSSYLDYKSGNYFDISPVGPLIGVTFPEGPGFPPLEYNVLGAKIYSEELNLTSKRAGPWRWTAGASFRDAKDRLIQQFLGLDNSDESKSFAVFGELSRRFLHDRFEWTLGLRYFHDDESTTDNQPPPGVSADHFTASFNSTTPRVVLSWFPNPNFTPYASYSQGFRSGFGQQPVVLEAAPQFPPVKPDKLHNYEMGAKGTLWDRRVSFDAAVYYIKWKDVQQSLTVLYQGASFGAFVNAESASGVGAEFAVSTRPIEGLELGLDFSWNNLTFDKDVVSADGLLFARGQRLSRSPEYTAGGSIQYTLPLGRSGYEGKLALSGNYTSAMENGIRNGAIVVASDVFVSRASVAVAAPAHWSATAYVDNLNGYNRSPFPEFPGLAEWNERIRPRTVGLQLDYHFK